MCGIAGIVSSRAARNSRSQMAQRLQHRGPDGEGVWSEPGVALSHRRLAILDFSDAGHQPMVFGSHVLTYNGEIYNHERLRAALPGPWRRAATPRCCCGCSRREGASCLARLVGMFAFATWDTREQTFCWCAIGSGSSRCTTVCCRMALRSHRNSNRSSCSARPRSTRARVRDFLFHGYIPAPKSFTAESAKLPAGHTLTWKAGGSASSAIGILRRRSPRAPPSDTVRTRCVAGQGRPGSTPCRMFRSGFS